MPLGLLQIIECIYDKPHHEVWYDLLRGKGSEINFSRDGPVKSTETS